MKIAIRKVLFLFCFMVLLFSTSSLYAAQPIPEHLNKIVANITGFSTCCAKFIINQKTLYTDPWHISSEDKADIILLSHDHSDHYSFGDIKKILTKDTVIVAPVIFADEVKRFFKVKTIPVKPGDQITINGIDIQVVPAYENKAKLHLKEKGYTGYVFRIDDALVYFAGETDAIPEMEKIKADIALLPIDRRASMTPEDAANVALKMNVKIVIPTHYVSDEGVSKFTDLVNNQITVVDKNLRWMYP